MVVGVLDEFDPTKKITLIFASELWANVNVFKGNNGSRKLWDQVQNIQQQPLRQQFPLPTDLLMKSVRFIIIQIGYCAYTIVLLLSPTNT